MTEWQEREVLRAFRSTVRHLADWEVCRLTMLSQVTVSPLLVRLERRGALESMIVGGTDRRRVYRLKDACV